MNKTVEIRCAYCLEPVTVEIRASILEKYGADYEPTRCASCDYLKRRRIEALRAGEADTRRRENLSKPTRDYPGAEQMMRYQRDYK